MFPLTLAVIDENSTMTIGIVIVILGAVFSGFLSVAGVVWWASAINTKISNIQNMLMSGTNTMKEHDARLSHVEGEIIQIQSECGARHNERRRVPVRVRRTTPAPVTEES